jgi:hypothetical protein
MIFKSKGRALPHGVNFFFKVAQGPENDCLRYEKLYICNTLRNKNFNKVFENFIKTQNNFDEKEKNIKNICLFFQKILSEKLKYSSLRSIFQEV